MPARFSAYPPDHAALVCVIEEGKSHRIGRSAECELRIEHPSISRFHAEIAAIADGSGWHLHDTGSKNGLRVEGHTTLSADFNGLAWFAVGDVHCQIEPIDTTAAAAFGAQREKLRSGSRELSAQLATHADIGTLIPQALDVVLQLSGLERGFVLYANEGEPLRVRAVRGIASTDIAKASFSGSASAMQRALVDGTPVVCCDTADSPWLGLRPSVRLGGIRALVCVPLQLEGKARGAIYVDSRKPGPPITELDLELLQNVAQQAASAIAVSQLQDELDRLLATGGDIEELAPRWDALRPL